MTTHRNVRPPKREGTAEISEAQYTEWLLARKAVTDAKRRLTAATAALDRAAGNAAHLTVDGAVVIIRQQQRTAGRYVGVNYREDWRVFSDD